MIFDIICKEISYTEGDFGANLDQLKDRFPIAYKSFKRINSLRNSRTPAHYKDDDKKIPSKITEKEYLTLLSEVDLEDVYHEVFTELDTYITQQASLR